MRFLELNSSAPIFMNKDAFEQREEHWFESSIEIISQRCCEKKSFKKKKRFLLFHLTFTYHNCL